MSTTKTPAELAINVMQKLSASDSNEVAIDANQEKIIIAHYVTKMAVLRDQELGYWDDDAIPLEVFEAVTKIIAQIAAPGMGEEIPTEMDEAGRLMQVGPLGMKELREHTRKRRSGLPTPIEAF